MANVLNMEIQVPLLEEGAGYGAAVLAMVACHAFDSVQQACEKLHSERTIYQPDPLIAARYEERYQVFRTLYPTLRNLYPALSLAAL